MIRRASRRRAPLYRARDGMIGGVCKGVARYLDVSVFWTRVIVFVLVLMTGFWPLAGLYILAMLLIKPEPSIPIQTEAEEEFYHSYLGSQRMAFHRLQRVFDKLERRIQRLEDVVTARDYDWEQRLRQ